MVSRLSVGPYTVTVHETTGGRAVGKVIASITTSVDGYIAGPDDGPSKGLGEGGEQLHRWVFGGSWRYEDEQRGSATGEDAAWLEQTTLRIAAVVGGRWTYEAARHWGDRNPWGLPFFIVTHRPEEQPEGGEFTFVSGVDTAIERALQAAEGKDVSVMGGADVIRQALSAGLVQELTIILAPVVLGAGKRLFDGFSRQVELEHIGVRQSSLATFIDYRVKQ
jgi:dihydrofolate reductase